MIINTLSLCHQLTTVRLRHARRIQIASSQMVPTGQIGANGNDEGVIPGSLIAPRGEQRWPREALVHLI
jgi:hypothetical protein